MKTNPLIIRSTIVAALGGFLFGFDTAVISGAVDALEQLFQLSPTGKGFLVSSALIGTIIGCLVIGKPVDKYGRKKTLFALAILYFVSAVWCALAHDWISLDIARFIGGLAIGASSVVVPMYVAEIAPAQIRGRLVAIAQLNIVVGILVSFISNYLVDRYLPGPNSWRFMLGIEALPAAAFFFLLFGIVESPRWLVKVGNSTAAANVFARLGHIDIPQKIADIQQTLTTDANRETLFQRRYLWPIFLAFAIAMFNQLSGINALMYYAPTIFKMAGSGQSSALLQSVGVGGINLLFTLVGMAVIDYVGRRKLIIWGSFGYIASLATVTWAFAHYGTQFDSTGGLVVLLSLLVFQASHAFSQGAVIWVFISEIFPNAVRAKGQAFGSSVHWIACAAIGQTFPMLAAKSGAWPFGFFAAMMFLQLLWALKIMPETKGIPLEEIESRYAQK